MKREEVAGDTEAGKKEQDSVVALKQEEDDDDERNIAKDGEEEMK